jgi:hypothetical protein
VAVGDFNGDGLPDIATANNGYQKGSVSVLLARPSGGFAPAVTYLLQGKPASDILVADFNNDGHLDLGVDRAGGISVLLGLGDGTFGSPINTDIYLGGSLAVGDFNQDGRLDLAVASGLDGATRLLFGDGTGHFPQQRNVQVGGGLRGVVAEDLNGDGRPDLAFASDPNFIKVALNTGIPGTFPTVQSYNVGGAPSSITATDVDNNGRLDLVVSQDDPSNDYPFNYVSVLHAAGAQGTFGVVDRIPINYNEPHYQTPVDITAADFDGDGRPDLGVAVMWGSVSVLTGGLTHLDQYIVDPRPTRILAADINGDGWLDLVTANDSSHTVDVLLNTCSAAAPPTPTPTPVPNPPSSTGPMSLLPQPMRLLDTRSVGGPIPSGTSRCFATAGQVGIPSDALGVAMNVTATGYTTRGWLTVFANGQAVPATSSLNFEPNAYAIANGVFARIGNSGQVCVNVGTVNNVPGTANVVLDVTGYLTSAAANQMPLLSQPQRLVDTRVSIGPLPTGMSRCFTIASQGGIPADAAGVLLNVTGVGYTSPGWLTLYPAGQGVPSTSTVNVDPRAYAIATGAIARVGSGGQVCVNFGTPNSTPGSSHVILDATGYLPGNSATYLPMLAQPQRLVDTRISVGAIPTGSSRCFGVAGLAGIPADAQGVVMNVTGVGYTTPGWLTVYPNGQGMPATSTVNFDTSEYAIANQTIMKFGNGGQVCVNVGTPNSMPGSAQVILDATAYLADLSTGDTSAAQSS